jgi:L-fuconolactonase
MRIDAHQHFWRYNAAEYGWIDESMQSLRRDFLPQDLKRELDLAGFDGAIAVQTRQALDETRWLLQLAETSSFILGVIGWVDLRSLDVRSQLAEFASNPKFIGVRHIVQSEPDDRFLLRPEFLRGVAFLEEFNLTYDVLIYPPHLPVAAEFVHRFPRQRFVLDHLAKPLIKGRSLHPWQEDICELARHQNVYCKLSGLVTEADWKDWKPSTIQPYLDIAFECFGAEGLMIGSDWPVCTVAGSYGQVMNIVVEYLTRYLESVQDAVLGGNAERFWELRQRKGAARSFSRS